MITLLQHPNYPDFVERYHADPLRFVVEVCDAIPSEDQEKAIVEMIDPLAKVSIVSGTGCFAKGTMMMLSSGKEIAVESVRVGDKLMGADGRSIRNVLELKRGLEPMYKFTYQDGTVHTFNESHILCLVNTYDKNGRKAGDKCEVTVRDYLKWNATKRRSYAIYRNHVNHFYGDECRLPIPPYILGVWLGDGTTGRPEICNPDQEVIKEWSDYISSMNCDLVITKGNSSCYRWSASRVLGTEQQNPISEKLRALGIFNKKAIPDIYKYASFKDRADLLAGLIDADGHFDVSSGSYDFIQKDESIANDVMWIARSIGCHATVKKERKRCTNNDVWGVYYRVYIGRCLGKIPVKVERKKQDQRERKCANLWHGIKSVEPIGVGEYFGFVLDGDSKFLAHDFTVFHNTGKSNLFARLALWHLLCHPYAYYEGKIEIGSNTYIGAPRIQQVGDGIWKEMQDAKIAILNGEHGWICQFFTIGKTRVTVNGYGDQWFIAQVAMQQGQAIGVAGKHRFWQMIIIDEAAGVSDDHFDVIDGTQTQQGNRTLIASQGAKSSGRFYDSHHRFSKANGGSWTSLCFNSENSPFVTTQWLIQRLLETGGRDTPEYMIRVRGMFPELNDKYLLGRSVIERRINAEPTIKAGETWGHVIIIDVAAGVYRDKTVALHVKMVGNGDRLDSDPRKIDVVDIPVFSNELDWVNVVGRVIDYSLLLSNVTFVVDVGGQGVQFAKMLENAGAANVIKVNWGVPNFKKRYKERFYNQRAQCSVHAKEAVQDGRITFIEKHRKELLDQGSRIPYFFDEKSRYHIVPKEQMKLDGIPSPDLWDTVCMGYLEGVNYIQADDASMIVSGDRKEKARGKALDALEGV